MADLNALKIDRAAAPAAQLRRRSRRRWIQVAIAVVVIAGGAVAWRMQPRVATVQAVSVVTAYPSQQLLVLNATGYVVAQRKAAVSSKATGRLEWLGVAEGSVVKSGDVIVSGTCGGVGWRRDPPLFMRPGDVAVVLAFFVVATVLFPLGIGPESNLLARIAAGVLWCAALFASLLSLDRLFASDHDDGTLDLLLLAPWPLELAALAKCAAHWIVTGLPLSVLAPFLGIAFGLDQPSLLALAATLLVGTPTLSLIGGLAAALTLGARRSGALLALLALPLCVPTLIFGAGAIETLAPDQMGGRNFTTHLAILAALALVALATTPWAMAAALRQAGE